MASVLKVLSESVSDIVMAFEGGRCIVMDRLKIIDICQLSKPIITKYKETFTPFFSMIFLVLEQVIGTTLVLRLCSCDCLTIGSETIDDGTRF